MKYKAMAALFFLQGTIVFASETMSADSPMSQGSNRPPVIQSEDAGGHKQTTIVDEGGSLKIVEPTKKSQNALPEPAMPNPNSQTNVTPNVPASNVPNSNPAANTSKQNLQNNSVTNIPSANVPEPKNSAQEKTGSNAPASTDPNHLLPNQNTAVPNTSASSAGLTPEQMKAISESVRKQVEAFQAENAKNKTNS